MAATRDSLGMAMKATWCQVDGEGRNIFKDPATDSGTKKSARGLLAVFKNGEDFILKDQCTQEEEQLGLLKPVFQDGVLLKDYTLQEIRDRLLGG